MTLTPTSIASVTIVVVSALFLIGLGAAALLRPALARRFLNAFASTRRLHFTELTIRIVVGVALISNAPHVMLSTAMFAAGWILVSTSVALGLIPWTLHRRFAEWAVPQATRFMPLIGIPSLLLGCGLIAALIEAYAH